MNLWERNLQALQEFHPHVYDKIRSSADLENSNVRTSIEMSRSGLPVMYVKTGNAEGFLHSRYEPEVEVGRWWQTFASDVKQGIVLIGMGIGYPLKKALDHLPNDGMLLVIEPSLAIFRCALEVFDLSAQLADPRLRLSVEEPLASIGARSETVMEHCLYEVSVLVWPAYQRLFADFCRQAEERIVQKAKDLRMDQNTLLLFSKDWARNYLYNLAPLVKQPGVNQLFGKFTDKPAIIVSAGPSLTKNVHLLHQAKEKAVIICVDTAYRVLVKHHIRPDLIVALDGSEKNYQHFSGLQNDGVPLVFFPTVHHKIVSEFGGNGFSVAGSTEYVLNEFLEHVEPKGGLSYGGSVSTAAFDLACRMGANPVVLIGQDLAYTDGRSHAEGTIFESVKKEFNEKSGMKYVEGIDGKPVLTDRALDYFRRWFEDQIEWRSGERTFIDATEGGAKICGTEIRTLASVIEQYCQQEIGVSKEIEQIFARYQKPDLTILISKVREAKRNLHQLQRLARFALYYNGELRELYNRDEVDRETVDVLIQKLDRVDQLIKQVNKYQMIDLLLQQVLLVVVRGEYASEQENETERDRAIRATESGKILYSGILEASKMMEEHVRYALLQLTKN